MWVVAKIKRREIKTFKESLLKETGQDIEFYCPKIEYHQYFNNKVKRLEKLALENYIFCYHENFRDSSLINKLRYTKGLEYFLNGYCENQKEVVKFIKYCKCSENSKGYLTQAFFKTLVNKKAKFISGPFSNMMFEILNKQKNKLKIIVGNVVTTISDNSNYLYRPA
tara:strand:- start:85 stop:585 length:501 start_codon:yes stop_codon:yes gene_type:complete